jgi:hypothetical protein
MPLDRPDWTFSSGSMEFQRGSPHGLTWPVDLLFGARQSTSMNAAAIVPVRHVPVNTPKFLEVHAFEPATLAAFTPKCNMIMVSSSGKC